MGDDGAGGGSKQRTITVDYLARVEGEGALDVRIRDSEVESVELRIFEPPRFFEALLRGRDFREAPDITARICGICPVAYQMSACHAMEDACGVQVDGALRELRRLLYCGEWIESHTLHISMLHAPDFLGVGSVVELAKLDRGLVENALRLKKCGNSLLKLLGGRDIHPVNVRVGGFYRAPTIEEVSSLRDELCWSRDAALALGEWAAGLDFLEVEHDYDFVSLQHPDEYPLNEGRIVSSRGLDLAVSDYPVHFSEQHVAHSTALQSRCDGAIYQVGPLARYHHNHQRLPAAAAQLAQRCGLGAGVRNPFKSILVRAVEVVFACEEALRIIDGYRGAEPSAVTVEPRASVGHAATEAPRGLLYHRYAIAADGGIADAVIVPPTSQNQACMEEDLRRVIAADPGQPDDVLRGLCERSIRNYDPCISCATHFLDLRVDRRQR